MNPIEVRNLKIGEGIPKICVSIIGKTKEEILADAKALLETKADIAEWRADWYEEVENIEAVVQTAGALRQTLKDMPLIFTFRTAKEGGERAISMEDYEVLNLAVIKSGFADFVDVEVFIGEECAKRIIKEAHTYGTKVVASNHDFHKTPEKAELVRRLCYMQELDADIPKIAVMPQYKQDVLTLLEATVEMHEKYADRPIITMSMSGNGAISRISGEIFGSAVTFGAAKAASAPGQIEVNTLSKLLQNLHENCI